MSQPYEITGLEMGEDGVVISFRQERGYNTRIGWFTLSVNDKFRVAGKRIMFEKDFKKRGKSEE